MSHKSGEQSGKKTSTGAAEKIKEFEAELAKTKYNKKTQHHIGLVKAKIAKLKEKDEKKARGKGKTSGYSIKKTGDATVVLLGFPSVGKSTLLNQMTNAESKIGAYDFTTLDVIPGMIDYKGAKIQIFDVPGIVTGAASGKGRGKEVLSVIRSAELIILLIDATKPKQYDKIAQEVYESGIRLNKEKPDVKITKRAFGGISVAKTVKLKMLTDATVKEMANELGLINADILIRTPIDADELIDVIETNRVYIPGLTVLNKIDKVGDKAKNIARKIKADVLVSAHEGQNIEELKEAIFERLGIIRIYLKEINKKPDMEEPLILKKGSVLMDLCEKLHREFKNRFKLAKVWGNGAKFPGQAIRKLDHKLYDEDIVELHLL